MAANTVSNWTTDKTGLGKGIFESYCTIAVDTANAVAWTKKTPQFLNPKKPWTLLVSFSGALDTAATPLDIYVGYKDTAALSGTASTTATDSVKYKQLLDDCGYTDPTIAKAILLDPYSVQADVVTIAAVGSGLKSKIPIAPYYLFNFTAVSGTLLGVTITLRILQDQRG